MGFFKHFGYIIFFPFCIYITTRVNFFYRLLWFQEKKIPGKVIIYVSKIINYISKPNKTFKIDK